MTIFACHNSNIKNGGTTLSDTLKHATLSKTENGNLFSLTNTPEQHCISDVVLDKDTLWWTNLTDSNSSCILHFNSDRWDTLAVEYSPECWLTFPLDTVANKITVYWAKLIDTKYDFEIIKAVNKIGRKYNGKPFMILELINGSTLKATYPYPEVVHKLNKTDKERTLFPDKFIATKPRL